MKVACAKLRNVRFAASMAVFVAAFAVAPARGQFYVVNKTTNPPIVDGAIDAGEWDFADDDGGGEWSLLRTAQQQDPQNNRFRAMWDDDYLYVLIESNDRNHDAPNGRDGVPVTSMNTISFNTDNFNFYIDPNTDKEDPNTPGGEDGYQIAFNVLRGESAFVGGQLINTGLFLEAHTNTPFGNNGGWNFETGADDWDFVSTANASGQVVEVRFPWSTFGAPGIEDVDVSVHHPFAPQEGDRWTMDVSKIDGTGILPIWSWNPGQSFAPKPDGIWVFAIPDPPNDPCDFDGDSDCDVDDVNALTRVGDLRAGVTPGAPKYDRKYDLDGDSTIDVDDLTRWLSEAATRNGYSEPFLLGDSDLSGLVDFTDFVNLNNNWQQTQLGNGSEVAWQFGDFNGDDIVDFADFVAQNNNWQRRIASGGAVGAVPEPSGLLACVIGLVCLALRRKS